MPLPLPVQLWNEMTVLSLPPALCPQPADVGTLTLDDASTDTPAFSQLIRNAMVQLLNVIVKDARLGRLPPS